MAAEMMKEKARAKKRDFMDDDVASVLPVQFRPVLRAGCIDVMD